MHTPFEPYLAMLQKELATSLMPRDDDNARRIATYSHKTLTRLLLSTNALPALQQKALNDLDGLLDELNALLRGINAAMVLTGELTQHIRNHPDFAGAEPVLQRAIQVLLSNPSDASKSLLRKISAILFQMKNGFEQAFLDQSIKPDAGGKTEAAPPLDQAKKQALQSYLRQKFAGETELEVGSVKAITGGGSKLTLIVELRHAKHLPETVVVRADQTTGVVESTVIDEFHLVETLYAAGMPVPQPFAAEPDTSILGAAFVVLSKIDGCNNGDHIQIYAPSRSFGLSLARAMGKMHRIPPEKFGDRIPGAKTTTIEQVQQGIASFEAVWRNSGYPSVAMELAYAWLKDHLQFAEGRRALNHCDIGCHNMLAEDGELTALLDWETVIIGNPAHDLAYVYTLIEPMMPWEDFLAEYEKAGGTIPSNAEFDFYLIWTTLNKIGLLFIARSFFHSGMSSSVVFAFATQHLYPHIENNLYKFLNRVHERY